MALVFLNGFDQYSTEIALRDDLTVYDKTDSTVTISPTAVHGTQSLRILDENKNIGFKFDNTSKRIWLGFHYRTSIAGAQQYTNYPFNIVNDADESIIYTRSENGLFSVFNGAGTKLTDLTNFSSDVWYVLEISMFLDKTNGSVEVFRDGISIGSATGVNTAGTVTDFIPGGMRVRSAGITAFNQWWDNLWVTNDLGPAPYNGPLGELAILNIVPNSDSAVEWIPSTGISNYALVDDFDGDKLTNTTNNHSIVGGDSDLFGFTDLPATGDPVLAVQLMSRVKNEGTDANYTPLINTGAYTNILTPVVPDVSNINVSYSGFSVYQDGISIPWDESAVNAVIAGVGA